MREKIIAQEREQNVLSTLHQVYTHIIYPIKCLNYRVSPSIRS